MKNHNQHVYENNINSYNQNNQCYQQQAEVIENHNYNAQGYPTQYKHQQYAYDNHQQQQQHQHFVDHSNEYYNYTQTTASADSSKTNDYLNGQTYNSQPSGYVQHVDQNYPPYNSVIDNPGSHQDDNQVDVQYNQNACYKPAEQVQACPENQTLYSQVQSSVNSAGENGIPLHIPVSSNTENSAALEVDNMNVSFHTGSSVITNYDQENNELAMNNHVEVIQTTPSISLGGSNKNSWYQDEYENIPVVNTSHDQHVDQFITTQGENSSYKQDIEPNEAILQFNKNSSENEQHAFTDYSNQVELVPSHSTNNNVIIEGTEKNENFPNPIVQQEQIIEETNVLCNNNLEENKGIPKIEQIITDNHQPCAVIQKDIIQGIADEESISLTNVENKITEDINKDSVPNDEVMEPMLVDRNVTATPYDNLCEEISHVNIEDKVRNSPNGIGDNIEPNNNSVHNNTNEDEDKLKKITDRLKGGPKKFMHLNLKKEDQTMEANVEKNNAALLNQNHVAAEKLSRLKRSTEKTTKVRNFDGLF